MVLTVSLTWNLTDIMHQDIEDISDLGAAGPIHMGISAPTVDNNEENAIPQEEQITIILYGHI